MIIYYSDSFRRDFKGLPKPIQKITEKKLKIFANNPRYPSLRVKKMEGTADIFEGSITKNYRFTFQISGATYTLRRTGTHDILKKEN